MSSSPSPLPSPTATRASLSDLVRYFLYLGTFGFGGPVALIGFMGVALAQIMPGPVFQLFRP